ncbi:MAG: Hpt domain-containing protein, partial [Candidatus Poribacteria bacterium]|nr:Hpt domain-containing protein [Candidatus Poribacteria bacterium]
MIQDAELREIFKAESAERLVSLGDGLLHLETHPNDAEVLRVVFREAHSLKGSARMLDVPKVERVAHRMEDLLGAATRGELVITSALIDRLSGALDGLSAFTHEAITGETSSIDVRQVIDLLNISDLDGEERESEPSETTTPPENGSEPTVDVAPTEDDKSLESPPNNVAEPVAELSPKPSVSVVRAEAVPKRREDASDVETTGTGSVESVFREAFKIETIRVEAEKLDSMMTHAGELVVTKGRIAQRFVEISQIADLCARSAQGIKGLRAGSEATPERVQRLQEIADEMAKLLTEIQRSAYVDNIRLDTVSQRLEEAIHDVSLVPVSTLFGLFPRMARDLSRELNKEIHFETEGDAATVDKGIVEQLKDPLMHLVRNAIHHGIEPPGERERAGKPRFGTIKLIAVSTAASVRIDVVDDGRGLSVERIRESAIKKGLLHAEDAHAQTDEQIQRLIFTPGFSTAEIITDISGRGMGLDVVRTRIQQLRGTVIVESVEGQGVRFRIQLPTTLTTTRALIAKTGDVFVGVPLSDVDSIERVEEADIFQVDGRDTLLSRGDPISVAPLTRLLGLPEAAGTGQSKRARPCVIVKTDE